MRLLFQLLAVGAVALIGGNITAQVKDNDVLTLAWRPRHRRADAAGLRLGGAADRAPRTGRGGREGCGPGLFWGLLIGVGLFGAVIANIAFLGSYEVEGKGSVMGAVGVVGFMVSAAVTEEVLSAGSCSGSSRTLRDVARAAGHRRPVRPVAPPDHRPVGRGRRRPRSGGMLAAAYAVTRSLWLPIGLHFGWNFAAAGIFSTEVSGNGENEGLLRGVTSGSKLVTGGEVGPEGGLYAVVFGLLMTVVLLWVAHRRGRLQGPRNRTARHAAAATAAQ